MSQGILDQPRWEVFKEAPSKNFLHKLALGRRSTFNRYGKGMTVVSSRSRGFS